MRLSRNFGRVPENVGVNKFFLGDCVRLSEDIKKWRSERPDEWTMDRFYLEALRLEAVEEKLKADLPRFRFNPGDVYNLEEAGMVPDESGEWVNVGPKNPAPLTDPA